MSDRRVFSEEEVSKIILRATELQESAIDADKPYQPGITTEEIHRIAAEFGISASYLEQAIRTINTQPEGRYGFKFMGVPLTAEFDRVVEGEVDPKDFDLLLSEFPDSAMAPAVASHVGRTLTISNPKRANGLSLKCRSAEGRTRLKVNFTNFWAVFGCYYPAGIIGLISIAAMAERGMPMVGVAIAAGLLTVATTGFRYWGTKSIDNARKLADRIEQQVSSIAKQPTEAINRENLVADRTPSQTETEDVETR